MHALDTFEHLLSDPDTLDLGEPLKAVIAGSLADLIELAAVRWSWWSQHGIDLLDHCESVDTCALRFPRLSRNGQALFHGGPARRGEVFPVPAYGSEEWESGTPFNEFQERFKMRLVRNGTPTKFAHQLLGALNEVASNASEHSRSPVTPVCSYEVADEFWAFSVTDLGCGILASLNRNTQYAGLADHGEAIRLAVTDGVSGTGAATRGHGYTTVFRALVNRMCSIRLRTTGAVASWRGSAPAVHLLDIMPMPARAGFHVTISGGHRSQNAF